MTKETILKQFSNSIHRIFNKVYCRDIDSLFTKIAKSNIEFTPSEKQAMQYLMQDLEQLNRNARDSKKTNFF